MFNYFILSVSFILYQCFVNFSYFLIQNLLSLSWKILQDISTNVKEQQLCIVPRVCLICHLIR